MGKTLNDTQYKSIKAGPWSYIGNFVRELFEPTVTVGAFTAIAGETTFCGHFNHVSVKRRDIVCNYPFTEMWNVDLFEKSISRGPIRIGSDVWIGNKAMIMDGVTISDGAIIGANAVVAKDVPPYAIVVGNPGQIKKFRFKQEIIEKLLKIKWWEWDEPTIRSRMQDFKDINTFLDKYYQK